MKKYWEKQVERWISSLKVFEEYGNDVQAAKCKEGLRNALQELSKY